MSFFKRSFGLRLVCFFGLAIGFGFLSSRAYAEGSGNWGTASNRQSMLWYPSSSGAGGYSNRGYMLVPSNTPDYDGGHRLYVYVKAGETVFWGFRVVSSSVSTIRVRWFYDPTTSGFFPTGTNSSTRVQRSSTDYNASASGGATGRPQNASAALNGPSQITGTGYTAQSFTNNTGADRAFWVEISNANTSSSHISGGFNINFWDITVAAGTAGGFVEKPGRVYSRFWSVANSRSDPTQGSSTSLTVQKGVADSYSFHNDFGFYVPVDNTFTGASDDYFVKRVRLEGSGGWTNFFANMDGPRNDLSFEENRKSRSGTSSNYQYPLFISDPDPDIWKTTAPPTASLNIEYLAKTPPEIGGEAKVNVTVSLPAIVDVLIDLNGNLTYDAGTDILISEKYETPGTYQINWNGEDASGNPTPPDTEVEVVATVVFFPVHFPIHDLEQSLGITVTNIRPGAVENNNIFWDNSLIPRTGITPGDSPRSIAVNTTGVQGPDHIWWATGDNGFGNNVTINTWAGSYFTEVRENFRILPVQWLYFRGKSIENRVRIEWATAKEKDNAGFDIMRSRDAKNWEKIGEEKGKGDSDVPVAYQFWDTQPMVGPNYYRLRQFDFDGKEEFTAVIRVDFIPDWDIYIYPNPVQRELFIQSKDIDEMEVSLFDPNGKATSFFPKVMDSDKMSLDISALDAGVYIIQVKKGEKIYSKKVIKSN